MSVEVAVLRSLFLFEQLSDEHLEWLAARAERRVFDAGTVAVAEGTPADALWVLLEGRIAMTRLLDGEDVVLNETDHRGAYAGAVRSYTSDPDGEYTSSLRCLTPAALLRVGADDFAELVRRSSPMAVHLLDGLFVGVRNSEATLRQREHLARLGRLSATLAHELNNPAAAAVRATGQLRGRVAGMRAKLGMIASGPVDPAVIAELVGLQEHAVELAAKGRRRRLTALEEADAEDALVDRLEELGVSGALDLAPVYVAAGLDTGWLEEVAAAVGDRGLDGPLRWLAYTLETEGLMDEIEDATTRISELVGAVKTYSHLDSTGRQEVDVRTGLDATVVMLGHKLGGVDVVREYAADVPPVRASGAELNQVWTNLLDNAADAMDGRGRLVLRVRADDDAVVVEVADAGPGIPEAIRARVFEPFFTTKPAGQGSGLGLDAAQRIVRQRHGGTLDLTTGPGGTTVTVRLPRAERAAR